MVKVTYLGNDMRHASNPTGTEYMFYQGQPTEVKTEDADHYAKKEANGAPWKVEKSIIETASKIIEEVTEIKKEKPRRYGGKK